ncbi:hypothetical protein F5Y16DRAFT_400346 [Xylariaceae sp. FL0255]|nr:hypothetical protein F5Y16DRAFT_400346 [Xylariaceae sp. FL0255]
MIDVVPETHRSIVAVGCDQRRRVRVQAPRSDFGAHEAVAWWSMPSSGHEEDDRRCVDSHSPTVLKAAKPHHASVNALWETKWKLPASKGIYSFGDDQLDGFGRALEALIPIDLREPYETQVYAGGFSPVAEDSERKAAEEYQSSDVARGSIFDLRAAAVYRGVIKAYLRLPSQIEVNPEYAVPVVLFICGLDAYRTGHTNRTEEHVRREFAYLSVEIPGTGDCPAQRDNPESPDRLWSSVLDPIAAQPYLGIKRVTVHSGGGSHGMFDPRWINAQNNMKYPFTLAEATT